MKRDLMLECLRERRTPWDIVVIGGGATGVGTALDAAARGHDVALVEQADFGQGTSSRSTKLVHGGVRYLQQGNVALVMGALRERGRLRRNAPHLVHDLAFVVPNYDWWEAPFYGIGMKVYDLLAGKYGFGRSRLLSPEETIARIPTIETEGLRGGVIYHDGQFDDARLLIHLARTAVEHGAVLLNHAPALRLLKDDDGLIRGVVARDRETDEELVLHARAVVNATGPFSDDLRRLDDAHARPLIVPSRGTHITLPRRFLPGDSAIMVPRTSDGRVLFAIPWGGVVLVGTTDVPCIVEAEPEPDESEIAFLLETAAEYLETNPSRADILSTFAGIRPLVRADGDEDEGTAALSRDHVVRIERSGMITIAGGKWTTYRKMAEDAVDHAETIGGLEERASRTIDLPIHGAGGEGATGADRHARPAPAPDRLAVHGTDATQILALEAEQPRLAARLHPDLASTGAEVAWAVEHEMARTVEDVLSRRTRALLLDARAAAAAAPTVARLMAEHLGRDEAWIDDQVSAFGRLADAALPW